MADEAKRGRGRPKAAGVEREPMREKKAHKMKASPNWDNLDPDDDGVESPDKLHIDPRMIPDGMSLQWVTDSIYGQPQSQRRASFEKRGWTPVHQEDFDNRFDGTFMPKGADGEIKMDGLVLMARPQELTDRAKRNDRRAALEQVAVKEQALRGGDLAGVSLDAGHATAVRSNKINRSFERINVPED